VNLIKQINFVKVLTLAGAVAASASFAHATPILFDLTGVNTSAGSLTGTVTIDSITGLVTAADITFNDAAAGPGLHLRRQQQPAQLRGADRAVFRYSEPRIGRSEHLS
jgi:hypothetical protein